MDEFSGEQLLDVGRIPADIRADEVRVVGNYALAVTWSDGHSTKLYRTGPSGRWRRGRRESPAGGAHRRGQRRRLPRLELLHGVLRGRAGGEVRARCPRGAGQALRLPRPLRRGSERGLRRRRLHRHGPAEDARPAGAARPERVPIESIAPNVDNDSLVSLLAELGQEGGFEDVHRTVVYIARTTREPERWHRFAEAVRRKVPGG